MGKCRFLYNNLITDESMFTVSSLRTGLVTAALKEGTGSATLNPSGNYRTKIRNMSWKLKPIARRGGSGSRPFGGPMAPAPGTPSRVTTSATWHP